MVQTYEIAHNNTTTTILPTTIIQAQSSLHFYHLGEEHLFTIHYCYKQNNTLIHYYYKQNNTVITSHRTICIENRGCSKIIDLHHEEAFDQSATHLQVTTNSIRV